MSFANDIFLEVSKLKSLTKLIAIDGYTGSGKSLLAKELQKIDPLIQIVQMDDFYLPSKQRPTFSSDKSIDEYYDWIRLSKEVLIPLKQGNNASYCKYNWDLDLLEDKKYEIEPYRTIIIEGISCLSPNITDKFSYDYIAWVEAPYRIRLQRGIDRDGEGKRDRWENEWMPLEDNYVTKYKPDKKANRIIDGTKII